jgi:hypothetical protein
MMKKSLLSFVAIFVALIAFAQPEVQLQSGPQLSLDKDIHDYGTIVQNADGVCHFTVTNTGNEPLIISNAKGSCGCTVPKWSDEPILPGASTVIDVKYATNRIGPINKSVTITSNAINTPTKVIRIKGNVIKPEEAAASPIMQSSEGAPVVE